MQQDRHMTEVRPARPTDAEDMAVVQNAIYRAGLRESPVDVALVRERSPGIPTMSLRGGDHRYAHPP